MPDLLLEIGCEEIPARMISNAQAELQQRVTDLLKRERLATAGKITALDTPRRLAVLAESVPAAQPDLIEQITGPAVSVAFKDGQPGPPAHAFAKKAGISVDKLARVTTAKGEYLSARITRQGRPVSEVLAELLPREIATLYWPKSMYWRRPGERFVRPVRWIVAMLDGEIVPLDVFGVRAGNESRGHRILSNGTVKIPRAGAAYMDALKSAYVLGRDARQQHIRKALDSATRAIPGARWREDKSLLETVVNLTEFPSVILGNFDREFLDLPEEVLVTVMRDHQKYFAIEDGKSKLLPHFLAVLNTDADRDGLIRHGNERVLRARFNDAGFFWQTDQKISLLDRLELLKKVTFQKDLGSYHQKTLRVQRLCGWLSQILRLSGREVRPGVVHKAVCLAKTDLTTELVKEFTDLQGIVGGLYARVQPLDPGLPKVTRLLIADAIYDQYKPGSVEDSVPRSIEGAVLSIGDKADTIAGMFALGLIPSGSKDPFALRRQANGIVKIIAEHKLAFRLTELMQDARCGYQGSEAEQKFKNPDYVGSVNAFLRERVEFYLRDVRGFPYDVVNAVLAAGWDDLVDAIARAEAVAAMRSSTDFESISVAFKRIKNILQQAAENKRAVADAIQPNLLSEPAERELAEQVPEAAKQVEALRSQKDYRQALAAISSLRPRVDKFFDKVMVMVDDDAVRANRLALLQNLLREFSTIADFSEIVTEGKV